MIHKHLASILDLSDHTQGLLDGLQKIKSTRSDHISILRVEIDYVTFNPQETELSTGQN